MLGTLQGWARGMLNLLGKVRVRKVWLSISSKYGLNAQIFFHGPLKLNCGHIILSSTLTFLTTSLEQKLRMRPPN